MSRHSLRPRPQTARYNKRRRGSEVRDVNGRLVDRDRAKRRASSDEAPVSSCRAGAWCAPMVERSCVSFLHRHRSASADLRPHRRIIWRPVAPKGSGYRETAQERRSLTRALSQTVISFSASLARLPCTSWRWKLAALLDEIDRPPPHSGTGRPGQDDQTADQAHQMLVADDVFGERGRQCGRGSLLWSSRASAGQETCERRGTPASISRSTCTRRLARSDWGDPPPFEDLGMRGARTAKGGRRCRRPIRRRSRYRSAWRCRKGLSMMFEA